jgi:hypothetical protein
MKKTIGFILFIALSWQCNLSNQILLDDDVLRAPMLLVNQEDGKKVPLKLSNLNISVEIDGNIATTTMDMTFYNDAARVLEGQLNFPLENEQVISRFAMELNGKLREGVVVEKEKGRRTFESIVRRRVDPALLEMTKGNNFRARVFPIPANGYKRIVIGYEEALQVDTKNWLHQLTTAFDTPIDTFDLNIKVANHSQKPFLKKEKTSIFKERKRGFGLDFSANEHLPQKRWTVVIPFSKKKKDIILTQNTGGKNYFYIHTLIKKIKEKGVLPNSITLLWDVSDSGKNKDVDKELNALNGYFKQIKNLDVHLVAFSNEVHFYKKYNIKRGRWEGLKKAILSLDYDGGTRIGNIDLSQYPAEAIILSTDGLNTLGESKLDFKNTPITIFNSNSSADEAYLKYLAQASNGKYFDFNNQTDQQIKEQLLTNGYQFISAIYDENLIEEVYPSMATPVENQFSISGILKQKTAEITLNFGIGNKVLKTKKILISSEPSEYDVARLWAKEQIKELSLQPKKNENAITRLGKSYSLVTPYTSLIVLETVEDYVQYEIEPPVELMKEYKKLLALKLENEAQITRNQTNKIDKYAKNLKAWSKNKNFTIQPKKPSSDAVLTDSSVSSEPFTVTSSDAVLEYSIDEPTEGNVLANDADGEAFGEEAIEEEEEEAIDEDLLVMEQIDDIQQEIPRVAPPPPPVVEEVPNEMIEEDADKIVENNTESEPLNSSVKVEKKRLIRNYLTELEATPATDRYRKYLELKETEALSVTFYLEVGEFFLSKKEEKTAFRIFSNIGEMDLENREFLRILANKLRQSGKSDLAILLYEEIIRIKGEEPQAYRDLALVSLEIKDYQRALDLFYKVVSTDWEENERRFEGVKEVAFVEMNNVIALHGGQLDLSAIPKKWIKNYIVDVRIILNWSSDATDVDLWVEDPTGEKCSYNNKQTQIGGRISFDMTSGYGPEEFLLTKAIKGEYKIEADFYGDTRQKVAGNVTIDAQLFTNYGRSNQVMKEIHLTLEGTKERIKVGSVVFE